MRYRHKKRGSVYEVITPGANLQCSTNPEIERFFEEACFTVYRNVDDGAIYVRPTAEFFDGRFEEV